MGREDSLKRLEPIGQIVGERDIHANPDAVDIVATLVVDDHDFDFRRSHRVQHEQSVLLYNTRYSETDP